MSNLTKLGLAVTAAAVATAAFAGGKPAAQNGGVVRTDSAIANNLLTPQVGTMRELAVLKMRQKSLADQTLYLGGIVRATAAYSRLSKDASATSVHMRVTNSSAGKKTASQINVAQTDFVGVADVNSWTTGVVVYGASNVGRDSGTDTLSLSQAYLILGNLNSSSIFGFVGKKDVDFGDFTSVNFNAQPLNKRAFQVDPTNSVGVGFDSNGFNVVATLFNGGANATGTARTSNSNNANNMAVNFAYGMNNNGVDWGVGAGWLNGSRTNYAKTSSKNNGAWDLNGHFTVKNIHVLAEYNRTTGKANNALITSSAVEGYNVGAMYGFPLMGHNSAVNASFSRMQDNTNTASQFVLGWNNELYSNVWMGLEWAYNKGGINGANSMAANTNNSVTGVPGSITGSKDNTLTLNLSATF